MSVDPARVRTIAAALGLCVALPAVSAQEAPKAPEYRIKAAFLYNFMLYTEWPATAFDNPDSPFILTVAGDDPFGNELDSAVRGKTVRGRTIDIRRHDRAADITSCHLLFLTTSQAKHLGQVLRRFQDTPLLTVGEAEDFTRDGGVIRLFVVENKVQFEVNTDAAARARVKLSSKLLSLARVVRDPGAPKDR